MQTPGILRAEIGPDDHILGHPSAPVKLVEYGDYACPHTAGFQPIAERLRATFGKDLCFVFRHFPLNDIHPHAFQAAEAAECAAAQGKFWEMHATLLQNHAALDARTIFDYVERLELDRMKFALQLGKRRYAARVQIDADSGMQSGVSETPTLFINGEKYEGRPTFEALAGIIESKLKAFLDSKVASLSARRAS
jgi:protein-disulfide isomerase